MRSPQNNFVQGGATAFIFYVSYIADTKFIYMLQIFDKNIISRPISLLKRLNFRSTVIRLAYIKVKYFSYSKHRG